MALENKLNDEEQKKLQDEKLKTYERFLDKSLRLYDEHQRSSSRATFISAVGGYLAIAITLSVGAAGIIADAYMKNQDRDDQTLRQASQRKMQIIAEVSNSITSMREYKDMVLLSCHTSFQKNKVQINEERMRRAYDLLKAVRPVIHFFNDEFRKDLLEFIAWDDSIKDYCDKNAPSEIEWRKKQKDMEDQMLLVPAMEFADN